MYRLDVLGPPQLTTSDGSAVDLALGKPFAVLVFIALSDSPPSRAELARLFWPGSESKNARQSVRQTLWILRRALGDEVFAKDDPVALESGAIETDVARFQAALSDGDLEAAEALWRDRFMADFALPDAPEWTRWAEERELALEAAFVPALAVDAEALRQRGDIDGAVERLEAAINIDPYRESLHTKLLGLHLDSGRLSRAAQAIGHAREALGPDSAAVREMGARLERRLRRSDPATRAANGMAASDGRDTTDGESAINGDAPDTPGTPNLRTELVGRTREMALLLEAWRRAEQGHPSVTVITGPAGVGKTRLTQEMEATIAPDRAAVLRVTAERAESNADFSAVAELSRQLAQVPGSDCLDTAAAAILRRLSPAIPLGQTEAVRDLEPAAVAGSVTNLLSCVANEQPLLVILDEAQWIDERSAAVLSRLAHSLEALPCTLIACLQDEESDEAARDFADALCRAPHASRLELEPLSDTDVREMIALMVEFPDENRHRFREELAQAAGGNPLYLTELLRALLDDGVLESVDHRLRFVGDELPDPLPLPRSVQELLHRRLSMLSDPAIAFAGHLARMGGRGRLDAVKDRSGLSEGELARGAGELLSTGIVQWSEGEIVGFSHDRLRRTVLERFPVTTNGKSATKWKGWKVAAAVAGLLALPAAFMLARGAEPGDAEGPAFGGGQLLIYRGDSVVWTIDPTDGPPEEWRRERADLWHPSELDRDGPHRLASGDTVWYVPGYEPELPPAIVEVRSDGSRRDIVRMEGDVNFGSVSPDGRFMTWKAQNPDSAGYVQDAYVSRVDGSEARLLVPGGPDLLEPLWSPGGRYIATKYGGRRNQVVVVTPGGDPVATLDEVRRGTAPVWCGATDTLAAIVERAGSTQARTELALLDAGTGEVNYGQLNDALDLIACSPDGSAVITEDAIDGRRAEVLHDLETTETFRLPPLAHRHRVRWLPGATPAVPVGVLIQPSVQSTRDSASPGIEIPWGESSDLAHAVVFSDSSRTDLGVQWSSSDADVASVSGAGRVSANSPGQARVVAMLDGWLADTVDVVVTEGRPSSLLFDDRFETLDGGDWFITGHPRARVVMLEDGPALSLEGDGRYSDGIISRTDFPSAEGLTIEAEYRLEPTHDHQQQWSLSVFQGDPLPGRASEFPVGWRRFEGGASVSYPAGELAEFDDTEIDLSTAGAHQFIRLPELLPADDWVHFALQLRPDGIAQLYVDRQLVATGRLRLPTGAQDRYRVMISGAAVGADVHVRDLRVWAGVRW